MQGPPGTGKTSFINDSKATNADATARALAVYPDIFWIAGGKPKEGGIEALSIFFPRIRKAFLIGEAAPQFARTLDGKAPYDMSGTLDKAVEDGKKAFAGYELQGQTLGIVGLGKIGCLVADAAIRLGMQVLGLKRVRIGKVMLGDLPPGCWRYLRMDESFV